MKFLLLFGLFVFVAAEELLENDGNESSSLVELGENYHQRIGVIEAERIRIREAVSSRIVGGAASYNGEHPYMAGLLVSLTTGQKSVCGGTLLNNRRVLTAGSCWFDGYSQASNILVVLGTTRLYSGGTRVSVNNIYSHPSFNPYSISNDIAVLVIPYVSYTNYIGPIVLPNGSYLSSTFAGSRAEAIGFGKTSDISDITINQSQRDVFVSVLTNSQCQSYYGSVVASNVICTSGAGGKGTCGGDLGGPLILRRFNSTSDMLIGVASFTSSRGCQAGDPAGYSRLTSHLSWVRSLL